MTPLAVNRADLAWALTSVLPHVGSKNRTLDWVGFSYWEALSDQCCVFATDGYTAGIAGIDTRPSAILPPPFYLTPGEARDLLRFIRPTLVGHREDTIQLLVAGNDLHVGLLPGSGTESQALSPPGWVDTPGSNIQPVSVPTPTESEVYELRAPGSPFEAVYDLIEKTRPKTSYDQETDLIFKPDIFARFAKAARTDNDRLQIFPKRGKQYGAAYITVGDQFQGSIAGLTYEPVNQQEGEAA